jgi:hypothetical protein
MGDGLDLKVSLQRSRKDWKLRRKTGGLQSDYNIDLDRMT